MKNLFLFICLFFSAAASAQVANPGVKLSKISKDFFITTNSGILNTPVGLKVGFISSPGIYFGFRHGIGKVYHSDSDFTTSHTNLFSVTGGVNLPFIKKMDFRVIAQLGAGYGQWWDYRWERWAKSGYEVEGGLLVQKSNFLINITGNILDGEKTYPTGDVCVGLGFILNNCN